MTEAAAAPEGALSMDAAISLLVTPEQEQSAEPVAAEADALAQDIEPLPTGDEPASEAQEPGDGETEVETEAAAETVDAPQWWDAEDKAKFAELPPELQAIVAKQEGKREAITTKEKDQARQARQRAETEAANLGQLRQALDTILPQAQQTFASKWEGYTDLALANHAQIGAEEAIQAMQWKAARDADITELNRLRAVHEAAQQQAYQQFLARETERLPEVAPDLADPEKGPERKQALAKFLVAQGIPAQALDHADAIQLSIAYDAMRYRQLASSAKQALAPRPQSAPAPRAAASVRPSASAAQSPTQRTALSAQNAFNARPTIENAVALLLK